MSGVTARRLQLDFCGERTQHDPSASDVVDALHAAQTRDDGFVILSIAEEEYVQTSGGCLEYREGGRHFRAVPEGVAPAVIEAVFVAYLGSDADWRRLVNWNDVTKELENPRRKRGAVLAFLLLLVLAALVVSFFVFHGTR